MHSRSTVSVTWRKSGSVSAPGAGAPGGMMRRTSASSRPSSTPISVAAIPISVSCSAGARRVMMSVRRVSSPWTCSRTEPRPEHRERVADLLEQVHLRRELLGRAALAGVEVERVLDAAEVLLDRGGHGAHEPHRRRRQRFTLLLDRLVERQELAEPERTAHRVDALAAAGRARDVEQQVVQQLDRRRARVGLLADGVQALEFAVRVPEQALDRDARLEAAGAQRIDERAGHPPELVQGRGGRDDLHAVRDLAERREAAVSRPRRE